jgi:hypothetical protein
MSLTRTTAPAPAPAPPSAPASLPAPAPAAPDPAPAPRRRLLTRRSAGLILLGGGVTAAGLWRIGRGGTAPADDAFDETYRGRHLRGAAVSGTAWEVTVDGRPLHLMRRADGSYLSMVDHYTSHPSARDAARAAVDELGGQQLRDHEMRKA